MSNNKLAVIGIGNTLRRDDGIGIIVLESLLKFYKREGIAYLNFGTASFDLLHRLQDYDAVLLLDGINASLPIGGLKLFKLDGAEYNLDIPAASTHEINLKTLFEFSKTIVPKMKIYVAGIQIKDTSYGEGLSKALMNRLKGIVKEIARFIDKDLHGTKDS